MDDPTFYYSFNELSGASAEDASGHGNDGTFQGTTSRHDVACSTDRSGSYATFDGSTVDAQNVASMVSTPVSDTSPNDFTIEAWFRAAPGSPGGFIMGFGNPRNTYPVNDFDRLLFMDGGQINFGAYPGAFAILHSGTRYDDGQWHMASASMSSNGMELYVDATLVGYASQVTNGYSMTAWWRIGLFRSAGWGGADAWHGDLDDVALYPARLTAAQVSSHYSVGR